MRCSFVVIARQIPVDMLQPVPGVDLHAIRICVTVCRTNESGIPPGYFSYRQPGAHHVRVESIDRADHIGGLSAAPLVATMIDEPAAVDGQDMAFGMDP
jgi:hypothetical protein